MFFFLIVAGNPLVESVVYVLSTNIPELLTVAWMCAQENVKSVETRYIIMQQID